MNTAWEYAGKGRSYRIGMPTSDYFDDSTWLGTALYVAVSISNLIWMPR